MNKLVLAASILLSCSIVTVANADPKTPGTSPGFSTVDLLNLGIPAELNMISVADLSKELKDKAPMSIGFDIDDTALFSSPVFYRGKLEFSPNDYSYLKDQTFWDKANCGWDAFSMPKETTKKIIAMHQKRGDSIYFITGRTGSTCNFTTTYLQKTFDIKNMNDVIFAGSSKTEYMKTKYIKANKIKIYYGDADGDIISARNAGAEGIRIMRAANSSYKPVPKNGMYGERIVIDSQY